MGGSGRGERGGPGRGSNILLREPEVSSDGGSTEVGVGGKSGLDSGWFAVAVLRDDKETGKVITALTNALGNRSVGRGKDKGKEERRRKDGRRGEGREGRTGERTEEEGTEEEQVFKASELVVNRLFSFLICNISRSVLFSYAGYLCSD